MRIISQTIRLQLEGRTIYVVTGRLSQTVNVCDLNNRRGEYEWIVRLFQPHFVSFNDVKKCGSIEQLINLLTKEYRGRIEQHPSDDENNIQTIAGKEPISPDDKFWIERAKRITEICIDELVREFLEIPYLHRVEHSIHTRLYAILNAQPHFDRHFSLAEGGMLTQPIHKEWPEPIPRPDKGNRRGNFDLVILSPGQLSRCSLQDFCTGRLVPPIAIEMGLNYGEGHLAADAEKLINSNIQHGYLVHLVRELPHDPTIDQTIRKLLKESTIRVAFARLEQGRKYIKLLDDPEIHGVS